MIFNLKQRSTVPDIQLCNNSNSSKASGLLLKSVAERLTQQLKKIEAAVDSFMTLTCCFCHCRFFIWPVVPNTWRLEVIKFSFIAMPFENNKANGLFLSCKSISKWYKAKFTFISNIWITPEVDEERWPKVSRRSRGRFFAKYQRPS